MWLRPVGVRRGDVDDGSTSGRRRAARQHRVDLVLHAQEDRPQVDGDHAIEVLVCKVSEIVDLKLDGRRIDGEVQSTVRLHRRCDHRRDIVGLGHIGLDERGRASCGSDQVGRLTAPGLIAIHHGHVGAGGGEGQRDGASHAAGPAGNDDRPASERRVEIAELGHGLSFLEGGYCNLASVTPSP